MEYHDREYYERVFGGDLPGGFEIEFDRKLRLFHSLGGTGPLLREMAFELVWDYREFIPLFNKDNEPRVEEVVSSSIPSVPQTEESIQEVDREDDFDWDAAEDIKEEKEEPTPKEVTWKTVEKGDKIGVFMDGQFKKGAFAGWWGSGEKSARVKFVGDTKAFRIFPVNECELNC